MACQGSEDHATAIRLFNQFIREYPDDPQVADAHLSLGDLVIAAVKPTEKPTFRQITKASMHYAKVRELAPDNPQLFHDSTFNDGNLLETVAKEPEGHVNFYVGDKDELSSSEYQAAGGAPLPPLMWNPTAPPLIVPCHCPNSRRRMQTATKSLITANFSTPSLSPSTKAWKGYSEGTSRNWGRAETPLRSLKPPTRLVLPARNKVVPPKCSAFTSETSPSTGTTRKRGRG